MIGQPCYDECPLSEDGDRVFCELDRFHNGPHRRTLMIHAWTKDRVVVNWEEVKE